MKLRPGKRYTPAQLRKAMSQAQADELKFRGYVLQFDTVSETYSIVPWREAEVTGQGVFDPLPPIEKRTPAQRVDSLMLKFIADMKKAGGIPVLQSGYDSRGAKEQDEAGRRRHREIEANERAIKEIVGEAWKAGRTEITADVVRQVAAHFLGVGDKKHEAKLATQITRHED